MSKLSEDTCSKLSGVFGQVIRSSRVRLLRIATSSAEPGGLAITPPLFAILRVLSTEGEQRMQTLATRVGSDVSVVSRQVAALEQAALIDRRPGEEDRRVSLLSVSQAGLERFNDASQLRMQFVRDLFDGWTEEDGRRLIEELERLNTKLDTSRVSR